jgi:hypothetical protein
MEPINKSSHFKHRGAASIISMIFVSIFSAPAMPTALLSDVDLQITDNQPKASSLLLVAEPAMECGKSIVANTCQ